MKKKWIYQYQGAYDPSAAVVRQENRFHDLISQSLIINCAHILLGLIPVLPQWL